MTDLRPLVVPAVALAVAAGFIVFNLSGAEVDPLPTPAPTATPSATRTPVPTPTPVSVTLDVTGTLVFGDAFGPAAVEFPSGKRTQAPLDLDTPEDSAEWRVELGLCGADGCQVEFVSTEGTRTRIDGYFKPVFDDGPVPFLGEQWAPDGRSVAFPVPLSIGSPPRAESLVLVPEVSAPEPAVYTASAGTVIVGFAWYGDEQLVIAEDDEAGVRFAVLTLGGNRRGLGELVLPRDAFEYLSVEGNTAVISWSAGAPGLTTMDLRSGAALDHGNATSYLSNDRQRMAIANVEPPYAITILDVVTGGSAVLAELEIGAPSEIAWSPDDAMLAVVANNAFQGHSEVWIVDPVSGERRHLADVIAVAQVFARRYGPPVVWSPDSRFVAVSPKDQPGIAIIEAATGARMQATDKSVHVPIQWIPSE